MQTIHEVIRALGITMLAEKTDRNPHMNDSEGMDHWECSLRCDAHEQVLTVHFSMGKGHHGKAPEAAEVLDCLASDASGIDQSFEDWCGDYGYDTDSRKAEKTYGTIKRQSLELRAFMGNAEYDNLLLNTERL